MQQAEMKNPCRYCADKRYWCRGECIKRMAYKAARRELGYDKGVNTTKYKTTFRQREN